MDKRILLHRRAMAYALKKKAMAAKGHFLGCYWDNCDRAYDDDFKDAKNKKLK